MKTNIKKIGGVLLCFITVMVACQKSEGIATDPASSKLDAVLHLTGDEQLTAFNMLSAAEKVAVRTLHINKYQSRKHFTDSQKGMINEFIQFNKPEYYDIRSDSKEYAITYFAKDWLQRAQRQFKPHELYTLMFSLDMIEFNGTPKYGFRPASASSTEDSRRQLNPDRSPYNNESLPNCFCAVGSMFTCPQFGYKFNTSTRATELTIAYNSCTYAYTQPCDVEAGCGFGGWSTCDGNRCS